MNRVLIQEDNSLSTYHHLRNIQRKEEIRKELSANLEAEIEWKQQKRAQERRNDLAF